MLHLIKRAILLLIVPFQVPDTEAISMNNVNETAENLYWVDDDLILGEWEEEFSFQEGVDLYSMDDDNCSFDLFEDEEASGWSDEDRE